MRSSAAFFDLDDTLVDMKSMFSFQSYYFRHAPEYDSTDPERLDVEFATFLRSEVPTHERAALNRAYYRSFKGRKAAFVESVAEAWFGEILKDRGDAIWIASSLNLLRQEQRCGRICVCVTGASPEIVGPIARAAGLDHVLGASLERDADGCFTGELLPPQTIGPGKVEAMHLLADRFVLDLSESIACGDHISDLQMLESVGRAYVVAGDRELEFFAARRGWTILQGGSEVQKQPHV